MAKTIEFTYDGKDYLLEFTRNTVAEMERRGFKIADIEDKPMNALPQLFAGAFLANNRGTKSHVVDKIFKAMPDKEQLFLALGEMYQEAMDSLMDEPEEETGNLNWSQSW